MPMSNSLSRKYRKFKEENAENTKPKEDVSRETYFLFFAS
jgi:hypothetical protein